MTTFTKEDAINYFVDVLGYDEEDAIELCDSPELFNHIEDIINYSK